MHFGGRVRKFLFVGGGEARTADLGGGGGTLGTKDKEGPQVWGKARSGSKMPKAERREKTIDDWEHEHQTSKTLRKDPCEQG